MKSFFSHYFFEREYLIYSMPKELEIFSSYSHNVPAENLIEVFFFILWNKE